MRASENNHWQASHKMPRVRASASQSTDLEGPGPVRVFAALSLKLMVSCAR